MFSWQMGPTQMTTIVDYDAVKSLLMADNKLCTVNHTVCNTACNTVNDKLWLRHDAALCTHQTRRCI